jgi:hypothetical protein
MRLFMLIGALTLLVGCTDAVHLRHPETGKTVKCGPYYVNVTTVARERGCIEDYQRQGYQRVME